MVPFMHQCRNQATATATAVEVESPNDGNLWLTQPLEADKVNLICFPFAGGNSASFAALGQWLGDGYVVNPVVFPGRDTRRSEDFYREFSPASVSLSSALLSSLKGFRVVLYGHSMGAWFAWDMAKRMVAEGAPPELLVVAAQRAPSEPYPFKPNHEMGDEEMIDYLHRFESFAGMKVSMSILSQWILPVIRADLALCETHQPCDQTYPFPALVLGATQDTFITDAALSAWRKHLPTDTDFHHLEAGHFFVRSHTQWVAEAILRRHHTVSNALSEVVS